MAPGSALRSRASLVAVNSMPIIAEDDSAPPVVPSRSTRRGSNPITPAAIYNYNYSPFSNRSATSTVPTTSSSDGTVPDRKAEVHGSQALRQQEWIARRGGWYRLILIAILGVAAIIGLAVGLTVGLHKKDPSTSSTVPEHLSFLFPAGNYTLTTALSSVSTACSSSPKTWRCYPYALYSPTAGNASSATFFWTIVPKTSWSYAISSTSNPFAPTFSNLPLQLHDANQYTERLTFNFSLSHSSIVDGPLTPDNPSTTTCWFNSTVMSVTLWTRMRADYPAGIGGVQIPVNGTSPDGAFATWPLRAEIRQTQAGGAGVPDCRDPTGGDVGGDMGASGECGCYYSNFELGGGNGTSGATTSGTSSGTVRGTTLTSSTPTGTSSGAAGRVTRTAS